MNKFNEALRQQVAELQQEKNIAEDANRQKTRALAYVSHDLKTPLTAIAWFLQSLQEDEDLNAEQQVTLGYIQEGLQQIHSLLSDILDKVRPEDGEVPVTLTQTELKPFLKNLTALLHAQFFQKQIRFTLTVEPGIDTLVCDPVLLRQVLINLLNNAIKYNHEHGAVFMDVYREGQDIRIAIKDTGIGIPAEKLSKIYTAYYRVDTNSEVEGIGLGLSYAKKLMDFMGGQIAVESQLNVGTCFTLILPQPA